MTMETIIFLLNHMLTYCITVDLGNIVLKCKYRVHIEQLFELRPLISYFPCHWVVPVDFPNTCPMKIVRIFYRIIVRY